MRKIRNCILVSLLAVALVLVPMRSQAVIPALIAGWLLEITGGSILISDLVAGQAGIIAAVMWWDCNKFKVAAPCASKTPVPAAQVPKPAITVNLKPDSNRENPNPAKFNDPAPGSGKRDVTPKPKIAASGTPPPPAPSGPVGTGNFKQDPTDPSTGPTATTTLNYVAERSHAYGDVEVAGVIIVKQMFAPDRAFPFVAKVVSCTYRTDLPFLHPDVQAVVQACTENRNASNAALQQKYLTSERYAYDINTPPTPGTFVQGKMIVFYDQARDVTVSCDSGYTINGNDPSVCDLTNTAAVKKPSDTPCEMLFDPVTKKMLTDSANPACDGLQDTGKVTLSSADGSQTIEVSANAGNGFDITITKGDGTKTSLDTGIYDPGTGGYVIVHTTITPPPKPENGMGCGGPNQGACNVEFSLDSDTANADANARAADSRGDSNLKGKLDGIEPKTFAWAFIPHVPTASCSNPSLQSPVGRTMVEMDICSGFNTFSTFLNSVLAVLCIYGCAQQIKTAIRS